MNLRRGFAGTEHFLLAVAHPEQATVAAQALRTCGATYDALRRELAGAFAETHQPRGDSDTISLNPVGHQLLGCAVGLAGGLGAAEPGAEHVLLAFLWRSDHEWVLNQVGTSRQAVYAQLRKQGVVVPHAALLPPPPATRGDVQRVDVPLERLDDLIGRLPALLPEGAQWGWNIADESRGWVVAEGDFDLAAIVRRAIG
jgi:ATP-dependent Clp protease ATP-binding subunit ClpA